MIQYMIQRNTINTFIEGYEMRNMYYYALFLLSIISINTAFGAASDDQELGEQLSRTTEKRTRFDVYPRVFNPHEEFKSLKKVKTPFNWPCDDCFSRDYWSDEKCFTCGYCCNTCELQRATVYSTLHRYKQFFTDFLRKEDVEKILLVLQRYDAKYAAYAEPNKCLKYRLPRSLGRLPEFAIFIRKLFFEHDTANLDKFKEVIRKDNIAHPILNEYKQLFIRALHESNFENIHELVQQYDFAYSYANGLTSELPSALYVLPEFTEFVQRCIDAGRLKELDAIHSIIRKMLPSQPEIARALCGKIHLRVFGSEAYPTIVEACAHILISEFSNVFARAVQLAQDKAEEAGIAPSSVIYVDLELDPILARWSDIARTEQIPERAFQFVITVMRLAYRRKHSPEEYNAKNMTAWLKRYSKEFIPDENDFGFVYDCADALEVTDEIRDLIKIAESNSIS